MFKYSSDGTYDEAVEASAEQIMMASTGSSGYASDTEASDGAETASEFGPSVSSSISVSSSDLDEEDSGSEDIEDQISYLHQKQVLLQRAINHLKSEEVYDAMHARIVAKSDISIRSPLWVEAKEVLEILNRRDGGPNPSALKKRSVSFAKTQQPKKGTKIDISEVTCLSSDSYGTQAKKSTVRASEPMPFDLIGPWMAQAVARNLPFSARYQTNEKSANKHWEIVDDADLGVLVFPPTKAPLQNSIQLKDALGFTSTAQLITLSSPPFCVVHANKAFSVYSGLTGPEIIGKPVESILHVVEDEELKDQLSPLKGEFVSSKDSCRMGVLPITSSKQGGMSHLLVKISPGDAPSATISSNDAQTTLGAPLEKDSSVAEGRNDEHIMLGTVG